MPPEDVGKNTVTALNTEYDLMKAAMKRVHELSQSGKLIHKAALRVLHGNTKETAIVTQEPITVNIGDDDPVHTLTGDLSNPHSEDIPEDTELSAERYDNITDKYFEETVRSLAVAVAKTMTPNKSKAITKKGHDSVRRKLITESGGKNRSDAVVTLSTSQNTRGERKRKRDVKKALKK